MSVDRHESVSIVIVNYRTPLLTIDCLHSVAASCEYSQPSTVILVDNASPDDSVAVLQQAISSSGIQEWVHLIPALQNGGFAYGNNLAIEEAFQTKPNTDYVLLLNPDTIVHPGAIAELVKFLDAHPKVGIVGSRLENRDGTPQESAFRFPSLASELVGGARFGPLTRLLQKYVVAKPVSNEPHSTDWVAGASMMIRRDVFDQIGLLDEKYFMYYEEVDFCKRTQQAGWECWYVPQSRVIHLVGQASGISSADTKPKRRPDYVFESRRRYFQKHHGRLFAKLADIAWLTTYPIWRLRLWIQRKPNLDPPKLWWDMLRHSSLWNGIER